MACPSCGCSITHKYDELETGKFEVCSSCTEVFTPDEVEYQIKMIRMCTEHKYRVSRDYKWLWQLCHKTPIICIVSYLDCRDIASTLVYDDTVQVSARGISYIYARDEEDFIHQCTQSFLEWVITTEGGSNDK